MTMKPKITSRVRLWALTTCAGTALAMLTGAAHADPITGAPKLADQHAPAGVMFDLCLRGFGSRRRDADRGSYRREECAQARTGRPNRNRLRAALPSAIFHRDALLPNRLSRRGRGVRLFSLVATVQPRLATRRQLLAILAAIRLFLSTETRGRWLAGE